MNKKTREEIDRLFSLSEGVEQELADRYVQLARKKAQKYRISLRKYNRLHCRKCGTYWNSNTLRVRTTKTSTVYTCLSCGEHKRYRK